MVVAILSPAAATIFTKKREATESNRFEEGRRRGVAAPSRGPRLPRYYTVFVMFDYAGPTNHLAAGCSDFGQTVLQINKRGMASKEFAGGSRSDSFRPVNKNNVSFRAILDKVEFEN